MSISATYTNARAHLAKYCHEAAANQEVVIIDRRAHEKIALISLNELLSLLETVHLLRSPKNARRLLKALNRAQRKPLRPTPLEQFKKEMGL